MKITVIQERTPALLAQLTAVWEASVKATHTFLSAGEREQIKGCVPQALAQVPCLLAAWAAPDKPVGFLGIAGDSLEMLFLAPEARGKGLGKRLLRTAVEDYGVTRLTVNQQNPQAVGFYQHLGFRVTHTTPLDEQGRPYPLLYMTNQPPHPPTQRSDPKLRCPSTPTSADTPPPSIMTRKDQAPPQRGAFCVPELSRPSTAPTNDLAIPSLFIYPPDSRPLPVE